MKEEDDLGRAAGFSEASEADAPDLLGHLERRRAGEECPYGCPVCTAISVVRQMSPEVSAHLSAAAREFFLAARAFLDSIGDPKDRREGEGGVEKIPLD
jgi:hypothetical protein